MTKSDDDFISADEAGAERKVTGRQVRKWIASGLLPAKKVGRDYIIRRGDLARVPAERKRGPKPQTGKSPQTKSK